MLVTPEFEGSLKVSFEDIKIESFKYAGRAPYSYSGVVGDLFRALCFIGCSAANRHK